MLSNATMDPTDEMPPAAETDAMARRLEEAFARTPHLPLWSMTWELNGATVVLRGRVRSFYLKQLAQSVALRQAGIERVINEIDVDGTVWRKGGASDLS